MSVAFLFALRALLACLCQTKNGRRQLNGFGQNSERFDKKFGHRASPPLEWKALPST